MNKMRRKAVKRGICAIVMVIMIILLNIAPVIAQMPDISYWAIETLNEGEKYGIFPIDWYYEDFRKPISQERLEILLLGVDRKIAALGLEKREGHEPHPYTGENTRGNVVVRLFNVLYQYNVEINSCPIEHMQQRRILKGNHRGLELEAVATTEEAVVLATRFIKDTYDLMNGGGRGLLWKVEHNGNTAYLLGSIHVGTTDLYPLHRRLREAFNASDVLVVEANLFGEEEALEYFMLKSMFLDGTELADVISPELYEKTAMVLEMFGLPIEFFNYYKPWSIGNTLNVLSMTNSQNLEEQAEAVGLGIDMYFLLRALLTNKPVIELEGIRFQADLFDSLSLEYQTMYLEGVLNNILEPQEEDSITSAKILEEWLRLWINGDIEGFSNSFTITAEGGEDELTVMLFGQRDIDMAEKIMFLLEYSENTTFFVVVGAGHLIMENTIIDILIENGFNVIVLE